MTALRYHADIAKAVAACPPWDLPGRFTLAVGVLVTKGCATYREKGHLLQGQPTNFPGFLPTLPDELRKAICGRSQTSARLSTDRLVLIIAA